MKQYRGRTRRFGAFQQGRIVVHDRIGSMALVAVAFVGSVQRPVDTEERGSHSRKRRDQ